MFSLMKLLIIIIIIIIIINVCVSIEVIRNILKVL